MHIPDQVLDLFELVAGVESLVVIGDVPGVEVEPDVGMVHGLDRFEHRPGVLGGPFVSFEGRRRSRSRRRSADSTEVFDDRPPFVGVGRLAGPGDANATSNHRAAKRILRSVVSGPSSVRMSAPPTLQPLTFAPCRSRWSRNFRRSSSSVFSVITADSGITRPPESWLRRASSMIKARPRGSSRRPSRPRRTVAIGVTAHEPSHVISTRLRASGRIDSRRGIRVSETGGSIESRAIGTSLAGSTTRTARRPSRTSSKTLAADIAPPALHQGRDLALGAAVEVPADQVLHVGDIRDQARGESFWAQQKASAEESRLATVESPGPSSGREVGSGRFSSAADGLPRRGLPGSRRFG